MTSKERVLKAIRHKETDKLPVDLGGSLVTGIHIFSYNSLRQALGVSSGLPVLIDTSQMLALVEKEVIEVLQVDTVPLMGVYDPMGVKNGVGYKTFSFPNGLKCLVSKDFNPKQESDGSFYIEKGGNLFCMPSGGFYFDLRRPALKGVKTIKEITEKFDLSPFSKEEADYYKREALKLKGTDKAVIGEMFATYEVEFYFGYEEAYIILFENKTLIMDFLELITDMYIKNFDIFNSSVGNVVDILVVYKDLGNQLGPSISPDLAREVFFPSMKRFVEYVKTHSDYAIMLHTCGAVYEFIPDIIDCGFDILNPVQISARGMDPEKLKRDFGKDICFWGGGVDTQKTLPFCKPDEIRAEVRKNCSIFAKGGGFVFTPVHNVQANVPPENVIAAFSEANDFKL